MSTAEAQPKTDFIRTIVEDDIRDGKNKGAVVTRFPPEPNGYLHIGHAKAISISFGIAADYNGRCHLRFDDTNPDKEDEEFERAIEEDIRWLGYDWGEHRFYTSDYFETLYEYAVKLIEKGKAFVCHLSAEETREYRGSVKSPGKDSPHRNRSVEENLKLFAQMRRGEIAEGECVLRAKIDMASPNMNLRDPVLYRIIKKPHHRTGDTWCIYPMYDMAHGQSDSIEGITHSLCSLEFEDHRPLYDWLIRELDIHAPRQIEFARLNLSYTLMSKRNLRELVEEDRVCGWDDPRMPTLSGMRRRGYTPAAIRNFCDTIGVTKTNSHTEIALLEHSVREDLNLTSPRRMAVLNPLRVVIDNYPEEQTDDLEAINNPADPAMGSRLVPFSKVIYIERDDFMEEAPRKFFRLTIGKEVRLRYAYFITCTEAIKDDHGDIVELHCTYDPATKGGDAPDGRKVKGTLHWVSAKHAVKAEVRLYDRLFLSENPGKEHDFHDDLNPDSFITLPECFLEPSLANAEPGDKFQFERLGYFCVDSEDSTPEHLVFNRTVTLRDSWAKKK